MMKTDNLDDNKNTTAGLNAKGKMAVLITVQLLLMILAFFVTYTPAHAEEDVAEKTKPAINVPAANTNTMGIFQNKKKSEKNETTVSANSSSYLMQLVSGMVIVLLSIVVLAWIAKRFNRMQSSGGGNLRIVEGISMGARERVVVVEVDGERLLLGVSPGRINMLYSLATGKQAEKASLNSDYQENEDVTFSQKIAASMMKRQL